MRNKLIGTICLALGIIVVVTTGTSFAYFSATTSTNNSITGTALDFNVELKVEPIYKGEQLVPLDNSLIGTAINNNCIDSKGYKVCSLYKITLTNNLEPVVLNGYITSSEETNYTTDHLKGQLFNSNLTSSISTVTTLTNTEGKQYFKIDEKNLFMTEVITTNTFYLAVWLTETGDYQDDDYDKDFIGKIVFETLGGGEIYAEFNA